MYLKTTMPILLMTFYSRACRACGEYARSPWSRPNCMTRAVSDEALLLSHRSA